MDNLPAAKLRGHADLLVAGDQSESAQAIAGRLRATADLEDALAGAESGTDPACEIVREYPMLGRCIYRAGRLISVARPWDEARGAAARATGIEIAFEWCTDPLAGLEQGELIYIWLGTPERGPQAQWSARGWQALTGKGDHGRNCSHGGHWSSGPPVATLAEAAPGLARDLG